MIIITSHINCDLDAFSSMVAATKLYPNAKICIVGSPDLYVQRFLDDYSHKFPIIREKNLKKEMIEQLIVVDNLDFTRLGKISNWLDDKTFTIICYDHHQTTLNKIQYDYLHYEETASCVTLLIKFIIDNGNQITPFEATTYALGIYEDTGNFLHQNVTSSDFSAMAYLMSVGADITLIKKYVKRQFNHKQIEVMNKIIQEMSTFQVQGIEVTYVSLAIDDNSINISNLVQIVKQSKNITLFFGFFLINERIQLVIRNDYEFVQIDEIARYFGGGGHNAAASAVIHSTDLDLAQNYVIHYLKKQLKNHGIAEEVMTRNVEMVSPTITIKEAHRIILEQGVSTLVIGKKNIVGIATKRDVGKAVHHQMGNLLIEKCMSSNVISVEKNISIYEVSKIMIEENIGRVPVLNNGKFVGLITRSDLLRAQVRVDLRIEKKEQYSFDNVASLLRKKVSDEVLTILRKVGHFASVLKVPVYVVGGFVRDLLMGRENMDLDFVVEGNAINFAEKFTEKFGSKVVKFSKFGTAMVFIDGLKLDFVTSRSEFYQRPGILPEVKAASLRHDLYRRDFTINALAVKLNTEQFGHLVDFSNGRRDLRLKILKTLHNLSFIEDPTRILRAIRFEQRFNFKIEERTMNLMKNSLALNVFKTVSSERIREELMKACKEINPDNFFLRLNELGILKMLYQPLTFSYKHIWLFQNIFENRIWYKKVFPDKKENFWMCYLLILLVELSQRSALKFSKTFKIGKEFEKTIEYFFTYKNEIQDKLKNTTKNHEIYNLLEKFNNLSLIFLIAYEQDLGTKQKIRRFVTTLKYISPELSGKDLIKIGYNSGPEIGEALKLIKSFRMNDTFHSIDQEIVFAKKLLTARKIKLPKK